VQSSDSPLYCVCAAPDSAADAVPFWVYPGRGGPGVIVSEHVPADIFIEAAGRKVRSQGMRGMLARCDTVMLQRLSLGHCGFLPSVGCGGGPLSFLALSSYCLPSCSAVCGLPAVCRGPQVWLENPGESPRCTPSAGAGSSQRPQTNTVPRYALLLWKGRKLEGTEASQRGSCWGCTPCVLALAWPRARLHVLLQTPSAGGWRRRFALCSRNGHAENAGN